MIYLLLKVMLDVNYSILFTSLLYGTESKTLYCKHTNVLNTFHCLHKKVRIKQNEKSEHCYPKEF